MSRCSPVLVGSIRLAFNTESVNEQGISCIREGRPAIGLQRVLAYPRHPKEISMRSPAAQCRGGPIFEAHQCPFNKFGGPRRLGPPYMRTAAKSRTVTFSAPRVTGFRALNSCGFGREKDQQTEPCARRLLEPRENRLRVALRNGDCEPAPGNRR